jgi:metaxin
MENDEYVLVSNINADGRLHGMPDQATYDRAVALAQVVLSRIQPALSPTSNRSHLSFAHPPPFAAGLLTPLPAALTGDQRDLDQADILEKAQEALSAIEAVLGDGWALGAS